MAEFKKLQITKYKLQTNSKLQCPKLQTALSGLIKDTILCSSPKARVKIWREAPPSF
jgi:hypothetical protein